MGIRAAVSYSYHNAMVGMPRSPGAAASAARGRRFVCRILSSSPFSPLFSLFAILSAAAFVVLCLHMAAEDAASRAKTVVGHNLEPTPWHPFHPDPKKQQRLRPYTFLRCSYLACALPSFSSSSAAAAAGHGHRVGEASCPSFFRWIHRDLEPWRRSRISATMLEEAREHAAMRVVILGGRHLYLDLYYSCVQSRAMFTVWGLLQLLRRYPGLLPDVDLMFDCMDRPALNRSEYADGNRPPPPLFRYCTTRDHFDIPFPDWSFWGWSEINIEPWDEEFKSIKLGSEAMKWKKKEPTAYWKGNPDVQSPIRMALLNCNDSKMWGAQIMRQDWVEESSSGFQNSKLSSQCNHRYKIYAEGYAWSVSLKYILACGSMTLIVDPQYEDFFSRGLIPKENYWPVTPSAELCQSLKSAVEWGNKQPSKAEAIGRRGQALMQELSMDRVYDYMYHLILEYSKLQDFKPSPPSSAQEVCVESVLCLANDKQRRFLERSYSSLSSSSPCTLPPPDDKVSRSMKEDQ